MFKFNNNYQNIIMHASNASDIFTTPQRSTRVSAPPPLQRRINFIGSINNTDDIIPDAHIPSLLSLSQSFLSGPVKSLDIKNIIVEQPATPINYKYLPIDTPKKN